MRVCDRCGRTPVRESLRSRQDDTEYDFCAACREQFVAWLSDEQVEDNAQQKRVRGRKLSKNEQEGLQWNQT